MLPEYGEKIIYICILQVAELSLTVDGLEKERDFYFGKLRDIEVICQDAGGEENPVLKNILEVLYATEVSLQKFTLQCKTWNHTENSILNRFSIA